MYSKNFKQCFTYGSRLQLRFASCASSGSSMCKPPKTSTLEYKPVVIKVPTHFSDEVNHADYSLLNYSHRLFCPRLTKEWYHLSPLPLCYPTMWLCCVNGSVTTQLLIHHHHYDISANLNIYVFYLLIYADDIVAWNTSSFHSLSLGQRSVEEWLTYVFIRL